MFFNLFSHESILLIRDKEILTDIVQYFPQNNSNVKKKVFIGPPVYSVYSYVAPFLW